MLLGFSEQDIKNKEKEIIDFADIGDFINKPVKTYSSGMYSKLAFAITAILETDIMLIDEVLAVGDAKFKEKSYNKMKELISDDKRTVLIVSHSMETVRNLCDEVLWLEKGQKVMQASHVWFFIGDFWTNTTEVISSIVINIECIGLFTFKEVI